MKESYGESQASYPGPESCGDARKGGAEALTGAAAGQVLSREIHLLRGADALRYSGRQDPAERQGEFGAGPRAVRDPRHAVKLHAREPGDPRDAPPRQVGPRREGHAASSRR
jgi:hypothetical protein